MKTLIMAMERIKELEEKLAAGKKVKEIWQDRAFKAEEELARREAQLPIYQVQIYGQWTDTDKGEFHATHPNERRVVYIGCAPPPSYAVKSLPQRYRATTGKSCQDAEPRAVMLPASDGNWLSAMDVEHMLRVLKIKVLS